MTITAPSTTEVTLDTDTVDVIASLEAEAAHDPRPVRAQLVWTEAETGLWVANYGGYYGGTVDKQGAHYFVSDTFGQYVGDFTSLEAAQRKLGERLHTMLPSVIHQVA
jgi:hypothetical protein